MGTTAQHCEQRPWTSRSGMLSASWDHQFGGGGMWWWGSAPPTQLRSGGAFSRLQGLSLTLSTTLDSLPPSQSRLRFLKIPPAAHTRIWRVWQVSHQSRFRLLSQRESVPGQFHFLEICHLPWVSRELMGTLFNTRVNAQPSAWHSSDSGQRSCL